MLACVQRARGYDSKYFPLLLLANGCADTREMLWIRLNYVASTLARMTPSCQGLAKLAGATRHNDDAALGSWHYDVALQLPRISISYLK